MKLLKVGVYHHGCWGSFSTKDHPNVSMTELGAVHVADHSDKGVAVNCGWRITADRPRELLNYVDYLKTIPSVKKLRLFGQNKYEAYALMQFISKTSSFDTILKCGAMPVGPIVQEKEMEIHTVLAEEPKETERLFNELEHLGEVKVFKIADFKDNNALDYLTLNQQTAILQALQNEYYTWPRKVTMSALAKKLGVKRRTFQERLRLAEAKVIPMAIEKLLKEKK